MLEKVKKVLYWLSIYRPIIDILVGTFKGIYNALIEIKKQDTLNAERDKLMSDMAINYEEEIKKC